MKALLLDVGNSRLKWGVLDSAAMRRTGHVTQSAIREQGLSTLARKLPRNVDAVIACNVAGKTFATDLAAFIRSHCGLDVQFVQPVAKAFGVTNGYRQPQRLGADRWVAMIGARAWCASSCLVVDAGTAITIDALDDDGQHLGGQILPGLQLMASALAKNTGDLPNLGTRQLNTAVNGKIFAGSTAAAIASGVSGAAAGAVARALRAMRQKGFKPTVVLTGGDALRIQSALDEEAHFRPQLVLEGLARILE